MKKATILIVVIIFCASFVRAQDWRKKRDTIYVLATYVFPNSLQAQPSVVKRVHIDSTIEVIDSAKSTYLKPVKKIERKDSIYYLIPFSDTARKQDGKPDFDSAGHPKFGTFWSAPYPDNLVSEMPLANWNMYYRKTEGDKPKKQK